MACLLAACTPAAPAADGPFRLSVIGTVNELRRPEASPLAPAAALLLAARSQGLVRLDAQGQVEPGLAVRWDVSDDGLFYTFRIAEGAAFDADTVARLLRSAIARAGLLKPLLSDVEEVVAVTPDVVEIRLSAPRPDLLDLLARPEFALARRGEGDGPWRIASRSGGTAILAPLRAADDEPWPPVRLHVERAARAVARFAGGGVDVVTGGSFADLPIARVAGLAPPLLHLDPVQGLFGLQVLREDGPLATPADRARLAAAIDRPRLAAILSGTEAPPPPTAPAKDADRLRIAVPEGPGATLLVRALAAAWAPLGLSVERVAADDPTADLRLIDEITPGSTEEWPLVRFGCALVQPCSAAADATLAAARAVPPAERPAAMAGARAAAESAGLYLPLGQPIRWSLVARGVTGWQDNPRSVHPLAPLRRR